MKKYLNIILTVLMLFVFTPFVNAETEDSISSQPTESEPIVLTAPTFTITNSYYKSLKLEWTHNDANVTGYQIYRATSKSGKYSFVKTVKVEDTAVGTTLSYTDTKKTFNKTYYYKVRAYHKDANGKVTYSKYSAVSSKKVLTPAPVATGTYTSFLKNKITWKKVTGASGYAIYKLVNGKYVYQKSTTSLSYTETLKNSATKLQLSNSYKVRAYRKVSGKKVYGPYTPVITIENKLTTPKLTYTSIDHTSYKLTASGIAGATSYELYRCADETCLEADRTLVVNEAKLDEVISVESMADKQYFVVRAVRTINEESIYSDYSDVYTFSAIPAKVDINDEEQYVTEIVSKNSILLAINNTFANKSFEVYRATSKTGTYSLTEDIECMTYLDFVISLYEAEGMALTEEEIEQLKTELGDQQYIYFCVDSGVKPGKTYYYKVRTLMTENEVTYYSDYSDIDTIKVVPAKVTGVTTGPSKYNSTKITWDADDTADGYQVYRATSKSGKYTLVKETTSNSYTHSGTIGKKYYYKVRAYYLDENDKKVYGAYSTIKSRTIKPLTSLDTYPIELVGDDSTTIVKSLSVTRKSTVGSNVVYKFKFNFKKTWAAYKHRVYYTVDFYDKDYNYLKSINFYYTIPKGTKRNYSVTFEQKLPKEAVYYEFK